MSLLLPVLTTRRADRRDRGWLAWVAVAKEVAHLPLESAPADATTHVLEIYVEGVPDPLVVLAEPMGAPTAEGFPLRLSPLDDAQAATLQGELFGAGADGGKPPPAANPFAALLDEDEPRGRVTSMPPPLTADHRAALERKSQLPPPKTNGGLTGRALGEGRFVLEDLLGSGANGEVYRATHTALRRPVAVKLMHGHLQQSEDYARRFHAEALAISRLDHRNLLRVHDYGQDPDGLLYIVMELLLGKNLYELLVAEGPMPTERITDLMSQACAGLSAAHDAGIVHRDIKPENVVVTSRPDDDGLDREVVKVCDFGIAHWTPPADATGMHVREDARVVVGTPAYMAPEQIRNEPVDARTDVYGLGCVIFELATGRLPFEHEDPMVVLRMQAEQAPPRMGELVPDVSPALETLVAMCLEKDPGRRFADARAVRMALRAVSPTPGPISVQMRAVLSGRSGVTTGPHAPASPELVAYGDALEAAAMAGDVAAAATALEAIDTRTADPMTRAHEREHLERARLRLREPVVTTVLASCALDVTRPLEPIVPLLVAAGTVVASEIVERRRVSSAGLELRARVVSALRAMGRAALPAITAALEPLQGLAARSDEALVEDLLEAITDVRSEPAGDVVSRFVRVDKPRVGARAIRALAALWGPRAHPLLLGGLDAEPTMLKVAALRALAALELLDAWTVERTIRLVTSSSTEEVRVEAARALAFAPADHAKVATDLLHQRLSAACGIVSSFLSFGPREPAELLVAMAKSLLALDPARARPALEKLASSRSDVRGPIVALLQ